MPEIKGIVGNQIQNIPERQKKMSSKELPREGDIWIVKFEKLKEFSKPFRPCAVISNDTQNQFDKNIVVAGLSTEEMDRIRTFEVFIENTPENGLDEPSKICCNYLHTVSKELRLVGTKRIGVVSPKIMEKVKKALKITLNLGK